MCTGISKRGSQVAIFRAHPGEQEAPSLRVCGSSQGITESSVVQGKDPQDICPQTLDYEQSLPACACPSQTPHTRRPTTSLNNNGHMAFIFRPYDSDFSLHFVRTLLVLLA